MGYVGSKTRSPGQILEKHCSLMLYHTIQKAQVSHPRAIMALLYKVLTKLHRNDPDVDLFKEFDAHQNCDCNENKIDQAVFVIH